LPAGVVPLQTSSNVVTLYGAAGVPLTISGSGTYFSVSYATQAVTAGFTVRIPRSLESAGLQTNIASGLTEWLESGPNTNSVDQNSVFASELLGKTNTQTIAGQ